MRRAFPRSSGATTIITTTTSQQQNGNTECADSSRLVLRKIRSLVTVEYGGFTAAETIVTHCRTREAWEAADGAAYLVRELASAAPDAALPPLMPLLAAAAAADHYAHACHLQARRRSLALRTVPCLRALLRPCRPLKQLCIPVHALRLHML